MSEDFVNVKQFLGCYFHEDWSLEGESDEEVVTVFRQNESPENVKQTINEFDRFLKQCASGEIDADDFLLEEHCGYYYQADNLSGYEWMKRVHQFLRASG